MPIYTKHGLVTEWLGSGLQNRVRRFKSDPGLMNSIKYIVLSIKRDTQYYILNTTSPGGGIGIRDRLKICFSQGIVGSSPTPGTEINLFSFIKMKRVFFLVSLILGLSLFLFTGQQAGVDDVLKIISTFPLQIIITVFLINFIAIAVIGSLRWKLILESQNVYDVGFFKILRAKLAGFLVSYVTPSVLVGGEPVRAYMIKERSNCGWEKSFASVVIDQTIYFFTIFLFMIIGFLFLIEYSFLPAEIFYGFGVIIIFMIFVFYVFYSRVLNRNSDGDGFFMFFIKTVKLDRIKFVKSREKNIDATEKIVSQFFKKKRGVFVKALALSILEILFYLAVIWIIIFYLNSTIKIAQAASIFFLLTLANFIPIPGSLGSFEMALTFVFDFFGFGKSNGFTFSLIYRIINIVVVFIGFFTLIYFELKTISHHFSMEAPKPLLKIHRFLVKVFCRK